MDCPAKRGTYATPICLSGATPAPVTSVSVVYEGRLLMAAETRGGLAVSSRLQPSLAAPIEAEVPVL
jgi:hypothetical protein